jgi:hypothetical protein
MGRYFMLVVLVKRGNRLLDTVMPEQNGRRAGIFCKDEIGRLQHLHATVGHVRQVSDGSGDDVQHIMKPATRQSPATGHQYTGNG